MNFRKATTDSCDMLDQFQGQAKSEVMHLCREFLLKVAVDAEVFFLFLLPGKHHCNGQESFEN